MQHLNLRILQTLHQEHLAMLALLERLEGLLQRHRPGAPPPAGDGEARAVLTDLVAVMEDEAAHHFTFEENHLFPRFAELADPGIPMMLKDEHEAIRPLAARIGEVAREALSNGFTDASWEDFHNLGGELVEREVFHVQKEEMGFLPALDQMLDAAEDDALTMAYAQSKGST